MKHKYIRLKTMLLACSLALTTGCSASSTNEETRQVLARETTHFEKGEHIISVPILESEDIRLRNYQYEAHPGYDVVGISITAHGMHDNKFGGGAIVYINSEEVDCSTNLKDSDDNYVYLYFGTPKTLEEEKQIEGEFGIGEHIISIPISCDNDNRKSEVQYEYHEGYEVVGMATSARGKFDNVFGGGVILYKNIVPVVCVLDENGYTTFGTPKEIEKNLSR